MHGGRFLLRDHGVGKRYSLSFQQLMDGPRASGRLFVMQVDGSKGSAVVNLRGCQTQGLEVTQANLDGYRTTD